MNAHRACCCGGSPNCNNCPCCDGQTLLSHPSFASDLANQIEVAYSIESHRQEWDSSAVLFISTTKFAQGTVVLTGAPGARCYAFAGAAEALFTDEIAGSSVMIPLTFGLHLREAIAACSLAPGLWTELVVRQALEEELQAFGRPGGLTWWHGSILQQGGVCGANNPFRHHPLNTAGTLGSATYSAAGSVSVSNGAAVAASYSAIRTVVSSGIQRSLRTTAISLAVGAPGLRPCATAAPLNLVTLPGRGEVEAIGAARSGGGCGCRGKTTS